MSGYPQTRVCFSCKGSGRSGHVGLDGTRYEYDCSTCIGTGDVTMSAAAAKLYDDHGFDDHEVRGCDQCGRHVLADEAADEQWHSGDDGLRCEPCDHALREAGALAAGIPIEVIRGETTLRKRFSRSYIDAQCGRTPRDIDEL